MVSCRSMICSKSNGSTDCRRSTANGKTIPRPMSRSSPSISATMASCRWRAIMWKLSPAALASRSKPAGPGRPYPLDHGAIVVRRRQPDADAVASQRRHPFRCTTRSMREVLAQQWREEKCKTLIVPGRSRCAFPRPACSRVTARHSRRHVAVAGAPGDEPGLACERYRSGRRADFRRSGSACGASRLDGRPAPIPFGAGCLCRAAAPARSSSPSCCAHRRTPSALRGPMVPRYAFPPGIERSGLPHFEIDRFGLVDTGYTCRIDGAANPWS